MRGLVVALVIAGALVGSGCGRVGYDTAELSAQEGGIDGGDAAVPGVDGGVSRPSRCGDGVVGAEEACDDGNGVSGDGCEADCTYSCEAGSECDDGEACNGAESCDPETHACAAGEPLAEGAACGAMVCHGGTCAPIGCGDGSPTGVEECDDGNATNGDGCDNDCTFSCEGDEECSDGLVCNGEERCIASENVCASGTVAPEGTACDRDGSAATRDWCIESDCRLSFCGDGIVDEPEGEQCDDGNETNGDGCENDCVMTPAGVDAGTGDAGAGGGDGGVTAGDSGGGGEACGSRTCAGGQYCCNASCSLCAPMGMSCTTEVCRDGGPIPVDTCTTDRDCMSMGPGSSSYCAFPDGLCGSLGTCSTTPMLCPDPLPGEEVCGCDMSTYPSRCDANRVGESVAYMGPC